MRGHRAEALAYLKGGPGRRWGGVVMWAVKGTGGRLPRHRSAVLYLACRALELEFAAWRFVRRFRQEQGR